MTIRALFFAHYQDIVGSSETLVSLQDRALVSDCALALETLYPDLEDLLGYGRVAVNADFADADTPLSEGDQVAFMPPMSGGSK